MATAPVSRKLNLTRDQLAQFLTDQQQIRQFELLFSTVDTIQGIVNTDFEFEANNAAATANDALAQIQALSQTLDLLAVAPRDELGTIASQNSDNVNLTGGLISGLDAPLPVASGGIGVTTASANQVFAGPTSGAAAPPSFRALVATDVSGAALTRTNDTNVTVTLSGSPTTALLNATRLTMGWSGTLATTRGGTGLGSFTANGVMYASSTSVLVTGSDFVFDGTNLGIGTASPTNKLSVNGNVPVASAASFVSASSGSIAAGFSDNVNASLYIRPAVGGVVLGTDAGGNIRFATNGNATTDEKMQITSAGGVSFGSTGTAYGTVGQVLTSAGNASPTWTTPTTANLTGAITSIGTATSLGSFTSAELRAALTNETGTGAAVFATSPTLVTPALGTPSTLVGTNITGTANSLNAGFGVNQTWQAPTRAIGTTYTNSSGKPIMVSVSYTCTDANTVQGLIIAGTTVYAGAVNVATFAGAFSLVVPDGATYVTTTNAGTLTLVSWAELRL